MSDDLQRLIDESPDANVRQVLGAALDDGPSPERIKSAAAMLGLPAGAAALAHASVSAGAGAATLAQASASAGAGAAAAGKPAMALIVLKWLGIGALVGGVTATASVAALSPRDGELATHAAAPAARSHVTVPAKHSRALPAVVADLPDTAQPERTASAAAAPAASFGAAPQASVASFDAAPADTLHDEIALLDQARSALRGGNAAAALAVLDRYQSSASKHALGTEAMLLRVRALVQAGRTDEANALGRRYIARHPHDGYAAKLRRLLGIPAPAAAAPPAQHSTPATSAPSTPPPTGKVPTASF